MAVTRGSGVASSNNCVLLRSVVHGVSGVGGVCEMYMCLARREVSGLSFSFSNPVETEKVCDVCLCYGCVEGNGCLGPGSGRKMVLCLCV